MFVESTLFTVILLGVLYEVKKVLCDDHALRRSVT
jgi:hypothetical protein